MPLVGTNVCRIPGPGPAAPSGAVLQTFVLAVLYGRFAAAAARAAGRAAASTRSIAASSCAAETNHASYTLGGSETPCSSIAWKNGPKRQVA